MTEHTPLPWAVGYLERRIVREVPGMADGVENYSIAEAKFHGLLSVEEARANAALIVSSVNSLPALVKALEEVAELEGFGRDTRKAKQIARSALAAYRSAKP